MPVIFFIARRFYSRYAKKVTAKRKEVAMGAMDNMKDKAKDVMNDPDKKAKIEKMAKDKGISIDEAKDRFMKHQD